MAIPEPTEKQAKQIIARRRPSHRRNLKTWQYMYESWRGGKDYEDSNKLWMFSGEEPLEYQRRKRLATYISFLRGFINDRKNLIFAQPPVYDAGKEFEKADLWKAFNKNFDGGGNTRANVMTNLYVQGSIYGTAFALVDKGAATAKNVQEQIDWAEIPRVVLYKPQDVLDWSIENGRFLWVLLRESKRIDDDPLKQDSKQVRETYLLYHREYWIRFQAITKDSGKLNTGYESQQGRHAVTVHSSGKNPVGEVPLVVYRDVEDVDDPVIGEIKNYEIARLSQEIYNLRSNRNEQINQSIVNILVLSGKGFGKLEEIILNVEKNAINKEVGGAKLPQTVGDHVNN